MISPMEPSRLLSEETAKKWQVFTQVRYQGVMVALEPGRHYSSLDAMSLGSPVKSMKRFSGNDADVSTEAVAQRSMKLCDICRRYTPHWCSVL